MWQPARSSSGGRTIYFLLMGRLLVLRSVPELAGIANPKIWRGCSNRDFRFLTRVSAQAGQANTGEAPWLAQGRGLGGSPCRYVPCAPSLALDCWRTVHLVSVITDVFAAKWPEPAPPEQAISVSMGKGSYAGDLPPEVDAKIKEFASRKLNLVTEDDRPIPTNQWWTDLLVSRFGRSLWTIPLKIDTSRNGLDVYFPTRWRREGNDPESEFPLQVGGKDFNAALARAKVWSDWGLVFRMSQDGAPERYFDVTLVRGSPCIWVEYHGIGPELGFGGAEIKYFDLRGGPLSLPIAGDCLGIEYKNRRYGLFAPDGTRFRGQEGRSCCCLLRRAPVPGSLSAAGSQGPSCRLPPCLRNPAQHKTVMGLQPCPGNRDHDVEDHHRGAQGQRKADHPGLAAAPLPAYHE